MPLSEDFLLFLQPCQREGIEILSTQGTYGFMSVTIIGRK
nr:MAG TPA: hypothetical protein [Bacteriophage sp.]